METINIDEFSGVSRQVLDIALVVKRRAERLIDPQKRKTPQQLDIEAISDEVQEAINAVLESRSLKGLRGQLHNILARIEQREGDSDKGNPLYDDRPPLTQKRLKEMKRTLWKTVLEIFVVPEDRMDLPEKMDFREGIKYLAIDPARISMNLLKRLGADFDKEVDIIEFVKEILQNLEPLETGEYYPGTQIHRFYRIKDGEKRGMILGTQHHGREKYFYVTDIYGALMRADRILSSETDLILLDRIKSELDIVEAEVTTDWPTFKQNELRRSACIAKLRALAGKLKYAVNPYKTQLCETLASANIKDSLGRDNPNAFMAQVINRAREYLVGMREIQVARIGGYVAHDREILRGLLLQNIRPFRDFYDKVQNAIAENSPLSAIKSLLNPDGGLSEQEFDEIIDGYKTTLAQMNAVKFEPFLSMAEEFRRLSKGFFAAADKYPEQTSKEDLARAYLHAFLISKDEYIYRMLQRFHYRLSSLANKYDIDANRLINELREIEVFLSQYPVAPHLRTNMYGKKWNRYRDIVAAMIKTIETWEFGDQSKKDPAVLVENLKNIFKIYMVGTKS